MTDRSDVRDQLLREEDRRLVTGGGRFSADWNIDQSLHAHVLRSDRAHALLRSVDSGAACRMPGVSLVVTGHDLLTEGARPVRAHHSRPGYEGSALSSPDWYPLAVERVRYVGEPIAVVVATQVEEARRAAEEIVIEYDDLPVVIGAEAALAPGAPQVHAEVPGNLVFDYRCGDARAVEDAIARAAHVTRLTIDSRRLYGNPMEPRSAVVAYDAATERYHVWGPFQTPGTVRHMLAESWGLDSAKVHLHVQDVGGGFGLRSLPYPEYRVLMYAARILGRPICWIATRSESFLADTHGRAMQIAGTLALDADRRFLAMQFDALCDMGAYVMPIAPHIMTLTPERGMAGAYATPAIAARFRLALTNTVPVSAYRGAGRPDMAFAIERLVDAAATELGMDRIELRRRNIIETFPYTTPLGYTYDSGDLIGILDSALVESDWSGFEERRTGARRDGRLRGIGLSLFVEVAGNSIAENDSLRLDFDSPGRVIIHGETQSTGQSHSTIFRGVLSRALGVPMNSIDFTPVDASAHAYGAGSYASRTTQVVGHMLVRAAQEVVDRARRLLAKDWGVAEEEIQFEAGRLRHGDWSEAVLDLADRMRGEGAHPLNVRVSGVPSISFPNGAHIAEVEIDPETGELTSCSYIAVDDVGVVQNHAVVVGQVRGGVLQAVGQVFGEQCIYDETGQLLNASFADYFMPRAGLVPTITVIDHPTRCTTNALGVKGVGEAGVTGGLSAMMNAVVDALRPLGIAHIDPPVTACSLWEAIRANRREPGPDAGAAMREDRTDA